MEQVAFYRDIVDKGVVWLLLLMGFVVLLVAIERAIFYSRLTIDNYAHKEALELDLQAHLGKIASIASAAPFVGLLGTVLSIIVTFYTIGAHGGELESAVIMKELALALKATALGLVVAIPATLIYNGFIVVLERKLLRWELHAKRP